MKTLLIAFVVLLSCLRANAQVQELEQLKLDIEKLAQFKLILSQMKQGYQVLQNGYNSVRDAARGNFDLHKNYLDGLLVVNVNVKQSPALQQIATDQAALVKTFQSSFQQYQSSGLFSAGELTSLRNQYNECNQKVSDDLDVVAQVVSAGKLRMNDAERLQIIETIHSDISGQLDAVKNAITDYAKVLALRMQQRKDNEAFKKLSGLK
ncbi:MAG: TerB family tellurite resistance protein [Bacteroidota bacterium]